MTKNINIIEISICKQDSKFLIVCLHLYKENTNFVGADAILNICNYIFRKIQKDVIIFILDPAFILPLILEIGTSWNIEFFIAKSSVYSFSIKMGKKKIIFKNITKLLTLNLITSASYDYHHLQYWNLPKDILAIPYTSQSDPRFKERLSKERYLAYWYKSLIPHVILDREVFLPTEVVSLLETNICTIKIIISDVDRNISLLHQNWLGEVSISAISKNIFLKNYNTYAIKFRNKTETDKLFRPGYYGPKCEVIGNPQIETEDIFHFDFKSMYGNLLLENFPLGDHTKIDKPKNIDIPGFYYIRFSTSANHPVLPHKPRNSDFIFNILDGDGWQNDILLFTNGSEQEGLHWSEEIDLSLKNGTVLEDISYAYVFESPFYPVFKNYAFDLLTYRDALNHSIWKNLMVSLYGRMGMSPIKTSVELIRGEDYIEFKKNKNIKNEEWGFKNYCLIEYEVPEEEIVNSKVHYAAIITARARIKLYKAFREVEKAGGRLLYWDTDSLFVAFPKNSNVLGKTHGEVFWDPQDKRTVIKNAVFASNRAYSLQYNDSWETKIAGIPRNSITFEVFKNKFYSKWTEPLKIELMKKNILDYSYWRYPALIRLHNYKKRVFTLDKKQTYPYIKIDNSYFADKNVK